MRQVRETWLKKASATSSKDILSVLKASTLPFVCTNFLQSLPLTAFCLYRFAAQMHRVSTSV